MCPIYIARLIVLEESGPSRGCRSRLVCSANFVEEFNRETQLHGLAMTGGVVGSTGIAGLTLGGGIGWLMPKDGLALDNLRSADLVMADGRVLRANEDEHADHGSHEPGRRSRCTRRARSGADTRRRARRGAVVRGAGTGREHPLGDLRDAMPT